MIKRVVENYLATFSESGPLVSVGNSDGSEESVGFIDNPSQFIWQHKDIPTFDLHEVLQKVNTVSPLPINHPTILINLILIAHHAAPFVEPVGSGIDRCLEATALNFWLKQLDA